MVVSPHHDTQQDAGRRRPAFLFLAASAVVVFARQSLAAEAPAFNVQIESSTTIYTATPASSAIVGFKPHINFPYMKRRADGALIADATVGQTQSGKAFGIRSTSLDNGLTWSTATSYTSAPNSSLILPAGQTSVGISYAMSNPAGQTSWSNTRYRSTDGGINWTFDNAFFNSSVSYKSVYNNLTDIVQTSGAMLTTAYATRANSNFSETILLASTDGGQNWTRRSTIADYTGEPDMGSEGPSESSIAVLNNGSILSVFRTGQSFPSNDVNLTSPSLFFKISNDQGNTWSAPKSLGVAGVFPLLKKLDDGSVALTYGRYGAKVMFADETGKRWTEPTVLYNGPTSGHTELRPTNDGRYVYVHDQSSFYGPSYDGAPPAGYVYNNDQSANLKALRLNITRMPSTDDFNWAVEYHGDVAPTATGQGWVETNSSALARRNYNTQLGTDFAAYDTIATVGSKQLYYTMPATQTSWQSIDFASAGLVVDVRARLATTLAVNEGACDLQLADGSGLALLQLTSTGVFLEGAGGNASQSSFLEATHAGFSTNDFHRYRVVVKLDPLTGQNVASVYLDNDLTNAILSKQIAVSTLDQLRFGDQVDASNAAFDIDYIRYSAIVGRWNANAGGTWSSLSNWTTTVPNAVDAIANFTAATAGTQTVAINAPITIGKLNLDAAALTFNGTGLLRLESVGSAGIHVASGSHTINVPVTLASNTVIDGTGNVRFARLEGNADLALNGHASADVLRVNTVNVTGMFALTPRTVGRETSRVTAINIADGATLDLADNKLILDYAGASPIGAIRDLLHDGKLFTSITTLDGHAAAIGYGDAASLALGSTYDGIPIDATTLLLRHTFVGDASLDGMVAFDDLLSLAQHYGMAATWTGGDFNYDGVVDFTDLLSLAQNYGVGSLNDETNANFAADWQLARSLVPEPVNVILIAAFVTRRRRFSIIDSRLHSCERIAFGMGAPGQCTH